MKMLAAVCPLCQIPVALGPAHERRTVQQDEATMFLHLDAHTVEEWALCTQALRNQLEQRDELSRVPYWAMPRA